MNKYEIIKSIGDGTFGNVYEAINKITKEKVAIKKLKQKINSWEKCMNQSEVYFLRKLNHPNIIKLLEVIKEKNDDISLVFEYCDCNLYEFIKSHKRNKLSISEGQIQNIIYSITLGLSHLHSNNIMHRDLKPENILICGNEIKIADFGTAREIPRYNQYNEIDSLTDYICTRWYRAPECILKSNNYNEKVDIWALGCIMAELYNLRPLFPGKSEFDQIETIFKILGTNKFREWNIGMELMDKLGMVLPHYNGTNLKNLFLDISEDALDFMELIFQYDDNKRPSAEELLNHPYLINYRNNVNYNNNVNTNINEPNKYRKIHRNFSKNFIFWRNDYFNYNNTKNNNYQENPKYNFILPEIKRNSNLQDSRFNLLHHRNNSVLIKDNKYYSNFNNNNTNLQNNNLLQNKFRNNFSDMPNINSKSFVFSNYVKNFKSNNDEYYNEKMNNQFSTMANNDIMQRKNHFFDKIDNYNDNTKSFRPKMKIKNYNYHFNLNDKFKNFGYGYFPDGNYRSIFSIK